MNRVKWDRYRTDGKVANCANTLPAGGRRLKLTIRAPVDLRNCLRLSSILFIVTSLFSNLLSRSPLHRPQNARMRPAAAQVAGQRFFYLGSVGLGFLSSKALLVMIMPLMQ